MVTSAPGNAAAMDWPRAPLPAPISTCCTLGRPTVPLWLTIPSLLLLLMLSLSLPTGPASPLRVVALRRVLFCRFREKTRRRTRRGGWGGGQAKQGEAAIACVDAVLVLALASFAVSREEQKAAKQNKTNSEKNITSELRYACTPPTLQTAVVCVPLDKMPHQRGVLQNMPAFAEPRAVLGPGPVPPQMENN